MGVILVGKDNQCLCNNNMKCLFESSKTNSNNRCSRQKIQEAGYITLKTEGQIDLKANTILKQKGKGWFKK